MTRLAQLAALVAIVSTGVVYGTDTSAYTSEDLRGPLRDFRGPRVSVVTSSWPRLASSSRGERAGQPARAQFAVTQ